MLPQNERRKKKETDKKKKKTFPEVFCFVAFLCFTRSYKNAHFFRQPGTLGNTAGNGDNPTLRLQDREYKQWVFPSYAP